MINTILIVDDEKSICEVLKRFFNAKGYKVLAAHSGAEAIEVCQTTSIDLVILDLRLPDMSGLDILRNVKAIAPTAGVVMITGFGDIETAVRAMQMKADNFLLKPVDLNTLAAIVDKTLESYRTRAEVQYLKRKVSQLEGSAHLDKLRQPPEVYHAIRLLADNSTTNVLILGETGTGKGMLATIIHELSDRKEQPFVDINCAGLSSEFLESELFGHERGAFTDAKTFKKGLLEVANKGSIFLDEIGELSLSVQAKILKVLEQKKFRRLGGTSNLEVDVRIMAATNTNLEAAVQTGKFRADLYFRLNVMPVTLPPLRQRKDDAVPLANLFLDQFRKQFGKNVIGLTPETEKMLVNYYWPGNIRELKNVIERATLLCESEFIAAEHLPENLKSKADDQKQNHDADLTLEHVERTHIQKVINACNENRTKAAQILGIHRSTLIKKITKYGIN